MAARRWELGVGWSLVAMEVAAKLGRAEESDNGYGRSLSYSYGNNDTNNDKKHSKRVEGKKGHDA